MSDHRRNTKREPSGINWISDHTAKPVLNEPPPERHLQAMGDDHIRATGLDFIRMELRVGSTFALLAEQASDDDKIGRNRENARKACDTVRQYINQVTLSDSESAELHKKLEELEYRLRQLEQM